MLPVPPQFLRPSLQSIDIEVLVSDFVDKNCLKI